LDESKVGVALRLLAAAALALAAACSGGGGGGGNNDVKTVSGPCLNNAFPCGLLDQSYGAGGVVTFGVDEAMVAASTDPAGNAYVTGLRALAKVDASGNRVPGAFPMFAGSSLPLVAPDSAGNLFVLTGRSLFKLDSAGNAVTDFGDAGRVEITLWLPEGNEQTIGPVVPMPDGSLIIAGTWHCPHLSCNRLLLAKLDSRGRWDASFGPEGHRVTDIDTYPFGPSSLRADVQGNLLVAGRLRDATLSFPPFVAKLDRNANLVEIFAERGMWHGNVCATNMYAPYIATDSQGNVYIARACESKATLTKLDMAGVPVASFGNAGVASDFFTTLGVSEIFEEVVVGADGSIYVAGSMVEPGCAGVTIAKLDRNGQLVTGFGAGGRSNIGISAARFTLFSLDSQGFLHLGGNRGDCTAQQGSIQPPYVLMRMRG
jgi:hypothetical protein